MRNCFFYYIYFLCKLQYNFHVIHFFVKITNHCLVLFVIFHIKHQSFPLRALSSSGYSQSASLRSSIPNNCSAYQKLIISMQYCYFTFLFRYDRIYLVKKITKYYSNLYTSKPKKEVRKWKTTNYVSKSSL